MAGTQWAPVEAQFAHQAPRDTAEHTRVFGAPVSFSDVRPTPWSSSPSSSIGTFPPPTSVSTAS